MKILIVDDTEDSARMLATVVRLEGHDVHTAGDGAEALALAAVVLPEVVFLDIGLPDMTGFQVAAALRDMPGLELTRIIAVTGSHADEAEVLSFDTYLVKPIDVARVIQLLADL